MGKRIGVVVAALALAIVGTGAVLVYARGADRRALEGQQVVTAYVVRKDVPAGTTAGKAIHDGLIVQEQIASKGVPEGALTSVDPTYEQLVATSDLQPGELLLRSRFATKAATQGLLVVPAGKLAVSVSLDDASHVGSFVTVGSHIAVFDTFNVLDPRAKDLTPAGDHLQDQHGYQRATRLLVPDVEVLALGATTTAETKKDENAADTGSGMLQNASATSPTAVLVTLAVTQDQAQRLIHAARTGTITFALIGADGTPSVGAGVDDLHLFTGIKP